jgi:histidinol-phosphate aminotransferase
VRERIGGRTVHKLSSNENPYGPVPEALAGMRAVLDRLNIYPDGSARALKRRLCERLVVDSANLVVGNGSNEILRVIAQAVLRPGDECVFSWPSFVVYPMVTQLMGATAVRVPLNDRQAHDLEAMLAAVTPATRLVFLCNPNNPTGTIYDREAFARFMAAVPDHVLVIADEAYFEYATVKEYPDGLEWFDGERPFGVLRTFSKVYALAGLRVGYGVFPEPLVDAINKVREPFNVNTVAQVAAYYSLEADTEIERRVSECAAQRERLYVAFKRLGIDFVESHANFVYIMTSRSRELFEALLARGVIVRDFGTAPALRIGIGTPEDTDATIAAFQEAIEELGGLS